MLMFVFTSEDSATVCPAVLTWIIACLFLFSQNYKNKQLMSIPTWEPVSLMMSPNLVFILIFSDSHKNII